jgi:hypothetical protein
MADRNSVTGGRPELQLACGILDSMATNVKHLATVLASRFTVVFWFVQETDKLPEY